RAGGQVLQRPLENGVSRRVITYAAVPRGDLEIVLRVRAQAQRRSRGFSSLRAAANYGLLPPSLSNRKRQERHSLISLACDGQSSLGIPAQAQGGSKVRPRQSVAGIVIERPAQQSRCFLVVFPADCKLAPL